MGSLFGQGMENHFQNVHNNSQELWALTFGDEFWRDVKRNIKDSFQLSGWWLQITQGKNIFN